MAKYPDLKKSDQAWKRVKLLDLAILLYHVHRGAQDTEIGFLDARETLQSLTRALNKTVYVSISQLESALFSANLLDEKAQFWHPYDESFSLFVKGLVSPDSYHRIYGTIDKKESS